jgi:hypothetical protein
MINNYARLKRKTKPKIRESRVQASIRINKPTDSETMVDKPRAVVASSITAMELRKRLTTPNPNGANTGIVQDILHGHIAVKNHTCIANDTLQNDIDKHQLS